MRKQTSTKPAETVAAERRLPPIASQHTEHTLLIVLLDVTSQLEQSLFLGLVFYWHFHCLSGLISNQKILARPQMVPFRESNADILTFEGYALTSRAEEGPRPEHLLICIQKTQLRASSVRSVPDRGRGREFIIEFRRSLDAFVVDWQLWLLATAPHRIGSSVVARALIIDSLIRSRYAGRRCGGDLMMAFGSGLFPTMALCARLLYFSFRCQP